MEWEPEQQDLSALGFTGICREIYRVSLRAILPHFAIILSALLVAHMAAFRGLLSRLDDNDDGLRQIAAWAASIALEIFCSWVLQMFSSISTAAYVYRVASLYCTDGDSLHCADADPDISADGFIFRELPRAPFERLYRMFMHVFPLAMAYIIISGMAWLLLLQLDASKEVVVLPLQVLGGAECLATTAYVVVVCHLACVVAMLEDAVLFGAVRKSRALLAGTFWAAAAIFVPLDGCFIALQMYFLELVFDDALGLGPWFQVAAGAAMAVAMWAVIVLTLVAQPVLYLVCKNHHNEVVNKVHLNYIGEYQQLAVDGDSAL